MRLAPVPMYFASHAAEAIAMVAGSSRTSHLAPEAVDACRCFAALLIGARFQQHLDAGADHVGIHVLADNRDTTAEGWRILAPARPP